MIDFKNKKILKLKAISNNEGEKLVDDILVPKEEVFATFSSMRDKLILTNKRMISINSQGISGTKKDYTSIPYSKIQVFSAETAGMVDLDVELDITISGLGTIRFELVATSDTKHIYQKMSELILN